MAHIEKWDGTTSCPMWIRTGPEPAHMSVHLKEHEVLELSPTMQANYTECSGSVRCRGYYDAGRATGPVESCYPPEGEEEVLACDECGFDSWSEAEEEVLTDRVKRSMGD